MKRRILTLCLALALVASLTVPAFAYRSGSGTRVIDGTTFMYSYNASYTSSKATANMSFDHTRSVIGARITSTVHCESEYFTDAREVAGYSTVSATATNYINHYGTMAYGTVVGYHAYFNIGYDQVGYLHE